LKGAGKSVFFDRDGLKKAAADNTFTALGFIEGKHA